jgi:hypothetical protein
VDLEAVGMGRGSVHIEEFVTMAGVIKVPTAGSDSKNCVVYAM